MEAGMWFCSFSMAGSLQTHSSVTGNIFSVKERDSKILVTHLGPVNERDSNILTHLGPVIKQGYTQA